MPGRASSSAALPSASSPQGGELFALRTYDSRIAPRSALPQSAPSFALHGAPPPLPAHAGARLKLCPPAFCKQPAGRRALCSAHLCFPDCSALCAPAIRPFIRSSRGPSPASCSCRDAPQALPPCFLQAACRAESLGAIIILYTSFYGISTFCRISTLWRGIWAYLRTRSSFCRSSSGASG